MTSEDKAIIVGGGVGPMAGIALHRKIVEKTPAPEGDGQHLGVIHISLSRLIRDRTEYLLRRRSPNPGEAMGSFVLNAAESFEDLYREFLAGVPCNTFHADPIYEAYLEILARGADRGVRIHPINMIEATLAPMKDPGTRPKRIGLLSTTGTRTCGVWKKALEREGFAVLEPSPEEQDRVHEIIYGDCWGLKSSWPPTAEARSRLRHYLEVLEAKGAEGIILGCTELPLAAPRDWGGPPLIDPVDRLADALVGMTARFSSLSAPSPTGASL